MRVVSCSWGFLSLWVWRYVNGNVKPTFRGTAVSSLQMSNWPWRWGQQVASKSRFPITSPRSVIFQKIHTSALLQRPMCHYCAACATHQYARSPRQRVVRKPYQQLPDPHEMQSNNRMLILFAHYCLTTLLHQVYGHAVTSGTQRLCSNKLFTNPVNHKQNTKYSQHTHTHTKRLLPLSLLTVHTCR